MVLFSSSEEIKTRLISNIENDFEIVNLGIVTKLLGVEFDHTNGEIKLRQMKYIEKLAKDYGIEENAKIRVPVTPGTTLFKPKEGHTVENFSFRLLVGLLMFLALRDRPDIVFRYILVAIQYSAQWNLDLKHIPIVDKPLCKSPEEALKFFCELFLIVHQNCNCKRICNNIEYLPFPLADEDIYSNEVVIRPQTPFVHTVKEYYLISLISLICDIGGNLGLYLGLSILSMTDLLIACSKLCFARRNNNKLYTLTKRIYMTMTQITGDNNGPTYPVIVIAFEYIFKGEKRVARRIVWLFILLVSVIICSLQATKLVNFYLSEPIYTSLEIARDIKVSLPDVVMCINSDKFLTLFGFVGLDSEWRYNYSTVFGECAVLHRGLQTFVGPLTSYRTLALQTEKSCPICENRIFLIPDGEYFNLKKQINVGCGMTTNILIQRQTIIKLNIKRRPCGSHEESTECEEKCKLQRFQENITCSLPFVSGDSLSRCNTSTTAKETRAAYFRAYLRTDSIEQCACLPKCNETTYVPAIIYSDLKKNLAFTLIDLFSDMGSTLSSVLGMSVLT
uniref:Reverse transcriptase Ty1/copia-type domain-containing protein n=1 Tax=Strigamia maritima TaxID=126957 RepID=T1IQZ3_STRMM